MLLGKERVLANCPSTLLELRMVHTVDSYMLVIQESMVHTCQMLSKSAEAFLLHARYKILRRNRHTNLRTERLRTRLL